MSSNGEPTNHRDPLGMILVIIVAFSLLAAAVFLSLFYGDTSGGSTQIVLPVVTPVDPSINPEGGDELNPEFPEIGLVTADDLRELALALAAVITAVSGLFGLVATQYWRGREEDRTSQSHMMELERERLELERERLKLEQERYELQRERDRAAGSGSPPTTSN